jgi:hypothetical protein
MTTTTMSADEIDRAIHRSKLRLEQVRLHVRGLAKNPEEAARARAILRELLVWGCQSAPVAGELPLTAPCQLRPTHREMGASGSGFRDTLCYDASGGMGRDALEHPRRSKAD